MGIEDERREYDYGKLTRDTLLNDPLKQFEQWMEQALKADIQDPTAMSVTTVGHEGQPWSRMVLLKGFDHRGYVFYTNMDSRKARDIAANKKVCLHFPWLQMDRQVIISGDAQPLLKDEVESYFAGRPRGSKLAAWASKQSNPINSRVQLEQKFADIQQRFSDAEVPVPDFWGGYRVVPSMIEFWQGGESRLHDRFLYTLKKGDWQISRLEP